MVLGCVCRFPALKDLKDRSSRGFCNLFANMVVFTKHCKNCAFTSCIILHHLASLFSKSTVLSAFSAPKSYFDYKMPKRRYNISFAQFASDDHDQTPHIDLRSFLLNRQLDVKPLHNAKRSGLKGIGTSWAGQSYDSKISVRMYCDENSTKQESSEI